MKVSMTQLTRRALYIALACLASVVEARATWTEVAHASCGASGGASSCTTGSVSTTGADLFECYVSYYLGPGLFTPANSDISDSVSNSYTLVDPSPDGSSGDNSMRIMHFRSISPATSTVTTWSVGLSVPAGSASIACFAMTQGSAPTYNTTVSSNTTSGTGPTTIQAGSLGSANDLVFAGVGYYVNNTQSIDSGFSTPIEVAYSGGNHVGLSVAWKQVSAAVNPQWSVSGNNGGTEVAASASFTGTSGGGGSTRKRMPIGSGGLF